MDKLTQRLLKLVAELFVGEEKKQHIIGKVKQEGITADILEEVQGIINKDIAEYEIQAEREMDNMQKELNDLAVDFEREYSAIREQAKEVQRQILHSQSDAELAEIRKKIQDI
jgi:nitrogen regulatory protein PII-like uncharacterized protein